MFTSWKDPYIQPGSTTDRSRSQAIFCPDLNCEETGFLDRDVKPENILVDMCTDEAKLIDFGLASEVQQEPFTKFRGENIAGVSCVRHSQVK